MAFPLELRDASDAEIASLAPELGVQSGTKFGDGSADCKGIANPKNPGQFTRIPCQCPPARDVFIKALQANVHAGHALHNPTVRVTFPTDNSVQSKLARIGASTVTLQNLDSPGTGCPSVSTTFGAQQAAIERGQDVANNSSTTTSSSNTPFPTSSSSSTSASSSTPDTPTSSTSSSPSSTSTSGPTGQISDADIDRLTPTLGWHNGVNPRNGGDCDGAVTKNGSAIAVPCDCPPDRMAFIAKMAANVRAGHVVTNPSVVVDFPTDDSDAAKLARISAAAATLQNLKGPGSGCPIVSTTLQAQDAAIRSGSPPPPDLSNGDGANPSAGKSSPADDGSDSEDTGTSDLPTDPTQLSDVDIDRLTPDLGFTAGQNPDGSGSCDGAALDATGKPQRVPCTCPPVRADFIAHVIENVRANKVVNNTVVPWSFPTGSSLEDQLGRIYSATVSLQNLFGPGKGCPNAATTLNKQRTTLEAQAAAQKQR